VVYVTKTTFVGLKVRDMKNSPFLEIEHDTSTTITVFESESNSNEIRIKGSVDNLKRATSELQILLAQYVCERFVY